MSEIDIQGLNLKQLAELKGRIDIRAREIEQEEKNNFLEMMKQEAENRGLNLENVLGAKIKLPPKKSPPKYENPDFNPETDKSTDQYWTGKGRKPAWAVDYIGKHGDLEACLIKQAGAKKAEVPATKTVKKKTAKK